MNGMPFNRGQREKRDGERRRGCGSKKTEKKMKEKKRMKRENGENEALTETIRC